MPFRLQRNDVAMRFNDQSVLENMHAALTFELFREQNGLANIFSSIESSRGSPELKCRLHDNPRKFHDESFQSPD